MDAHLMAGAAVFNAGYHHAAHDAWEDRWLDLDEGADERLLHGLIQYTAAVHHGYHGNWEGVQGLADGAGTYLADLPAVYRGVALESVRSYVATLAEDPEGIERRSPPAIVVDGSAPTLSDLGVEAACVAAPILAEALGYPDDPVEKAVEYARTDLDVGEEGSRFVSLVLAFVDEDADRDTVYERLADHVDRRRAREEDVDDLF